MNKTTKVALIIAGVIVLSYPGLAWVTGIVIQSRLQRNQQEVLARVPYITVLKHEYHRGVYRSTETATYGWRVPWPQAAGAAAVANAFAGATLTITSNIQHGPLPGLSRVGLATVDTTVSGPPALQRELSAILGSQPILRLHTLIGLLGGATATVTSPAFSTHLPNGSTLTWGGLTGTVASSGYRHRGSAQLAAPRLTVQGPQGHFEITGVGYSGTFEKAFDDLYLGSGTFTIEGIDGSTPDGDYSLQRISLASTSNPEGQFFDMRIDLTVDAAKIAAVQLTKVVYSESFEHVNGPALAAMTQAIRNAEGQAGAAPAQLQAGIQGAVREYGVDLLLDDPVVDMRKVSFTMPEGTFLFSAKLSAPGLSRGDLQGPAAAVAALKTHGQMTADLSVDNGLVQKFLAMKSSNARLGAQLTAFEQQGFLTAGPGAVTTHLAYGAGKLTLNGHPFPPAPPAN